jgi:hydroxyethylthiazole kinase
MTIVIDAHSIWHDVARIRATAPLVHNITNYVVMNSTANALLALGASPVMAHAEEEVEDMVRLAGALVINIGTLSPPWVRAMHKAAQQAQRLGVPIVLDPVGAGATPYRTDTARELIAAATPAIVRGNASEIDAVALVGQTTKGVESTASPEAALQAARQLSSAHGCAVCVSGATDYVLRGPDLVKVHNGHPMMARVTGLGCTATALCGAFAAVNDSPLAACVHAMAVLGIVGEMAAERSDGPGSLQIALLDALHNVTERDIAERLKIEV